MKNLNLIILALFSLVLISCGSSSSNNSSTPTTPTDTIKDDDFRGFSLAEDSLTFELTEGTAEDLPITITSNEAVAATNLDNVSFTATFNISYGTATATDFSTTDITREVTGNVTIESDSSTNTATIDIAVNTAVLEILADDILEADETFDLELTTLEASNDLLTTAILIDPAKNSITITIKNDDKVELSIADAAANEAENLNFTVTVSGNSEIAIPFGYEVTADGANPVTTDDFRVGTLPSGTGSITANNTSILIIIAINDDDDLEEDETFTISLNSTNEFVITNATAAGTIEDNDFNDGDGNGLFDLTTATELNNINRNLAGDYELLNNLDLAEFANFEPIGEFTGVFEGNDFAIKNLTIDRTSDDNDNVGLFSTLNGATVRNLIIENPQITGDDNIGALAGQATNDTLIDNVGVLATNSSSFVTGDQRVGGLVGANNTSTISNSWVSGSVVGNSTVGGLVGYNFTDSIISNSWAIGSVVGGGLVGGLVGGNFTDSTINNSWAAGSVVGSGNNIGGLVGINDNSTINNSWTSGSVVGRDDVGGLAGQNNDHATISSSWTSGSVVSNSRAGGLVGRGVINAPVSNSYWNIETSGQTTSSSSTSTTFGVTTEQMITATGADGIDGETVFDNWNIITDNTWNFGENTEYPTIISNVASADFQLVYQVAGQIRLIPTTDTNGTGDAFFGGSSRQDELDATADNIATYFVAGNTLAIFDLNARAENTDNTRADFADCNNENPTEVGENLLTTTGVNGTTVTVIIAAGTTNTDWTATTACEIVIGTQPTKDDKLNLTVEITKGDETATRQFNITFVEE